MKKFRKGLIAAILLMAVVLSSVVTAHASGVLVDAVLGEIADRVLNLSFTPTTANRGEDELVAAKKYLDSVWRPLDSTDGTVEVTYQTLSDVLANLNMNGIPCQLKQLRGAGVTGYAIVGAGTAPILDGYGKYNFSNKYFTNTAGAIFRAHKDSGGGTTGNTYNYNQTTVGGSSATPSTVPRPGGSVSSVVTDRELQERIYHSVDSLYQYMSLMIDWLRFVDQDVCRIFKQLDNNVVPALEAINNNIISFKNGAVSSLRTVCSVLSDSYDVQFNLLGVARSIYSSVSGIAFHLDSVISNGVVQVGSASLEARLDKLISMYSKVNSVVLDTAAINGGQIKAAVGGELEDVIFWGWSAKGGGQLTYANSVAYNLNGAQTTVVNVPLRGMVLGSSLSSAIDDTDDVLMAGVWQGSNGKYYIADTYNAATGEYVQRLRSITYDGSEGWKMTAKSDGMNMFWYRDRSIEDISPGREAMSSASWLGYKAYDSTFYNQENSAAASKNKFTLAGQAFRIVVSAKDYPDVASWTSYLSKNPLTFWYVLSAPTGYASADKPVVSILDRATIAIPEGDSAISADRIRITGKYETYDSYTQTADIIAAINRLNGTGIGGDLTAVTSRLDLILAELQSSSGSASCEHTYTQHMEQEADCTLPGLMISTCSQCGDSYSEIVDPLGHDWVLSSHVDAVTDPDTGEETASAYDVYTCSRCGRTYEDHTGDGAPDEDYSNTSISQLVVKVFSKLGTFAGKLIGFFVHLLDKALTSVDNVISKFNDYTAQISGFGGSYTTWLTGFWGIIPSELQIALTFSVICMALGAVGKKLLFS